MRGVLVRVGVDHTYGGWNAPVDQRSNEFVYVPIPESPRTKCHSRMERRYDEFVAHLRKFCKPRAIDPIDHLRFPPNLLKQLVHLDPDFEQLTYGDDGARRGAKINAMTAGDFLLFYAGLRPVKRCKHKLIYALVGMYIVEDVISVGSVPKNRWDENAHTRKITRGKDDIVVRAVRGCSGRFERCIPIGEWRENAYRVRNEVLDAWGGLSVQNGYIQRSAVPPSFNDPERVLAWVNRQRVPLLQRNN